MLSPSPSSINLRRSNRISIMAMLIVIFFVTSACLGGSPITPVTDGVPRWACPTPTALPPIQVEDGTSLNPQGTPVPTYRESKPYEREPYNEIGKEPILRPTPHTKTGTTFFLGQIVNVSGSLDVEVTVETSTATAPVGQHLYLVTLRWHNRGSSLTVDLKRQLIISAIKRVDGRQVSGVWGWSPDATALTTTSYNPDTDFPAIPPGDTATTIPILAPAGSVQTVDLRLDPPGATPETAGNLRVQLVPGREPDCEHPGTVAASYEDGGRVVVPPAVPAHADSIVQAALQQVGRQYCWNGKGYTPCSGWTPQDGQVTPPCASLPCWDCSGLTWGAYRAVGVTIAHGTSNQKMYPAVALDQIQPGDLLLFGGINQVGRNASITHVGLYVGDIDGDGTGDMIHAANYPTGVVIAKNVLNNRYYMSRLAIITRPPRGGNR